MFRSLYLDSGDETVQIGTGQDRSDNQSVITTIHGYTNYAPDDFYVGTNEMWFAVIGGKAYDGLEVNVEIISIDLSSKCEIILHFSYLNIIYVGYHYIAQCTS